MLKIKRLKLAEMQKQTAELSDIKNKLSDICSALKNDKKVAVEYEFLD